MNYIITKEPGGELIIKSDFTNPIILSHSGEEKIIKIDNISQLVSLDKLATEYSGENNTRTLKMSYRIALSDKPNKWTDWMVLSPNGNSECFLEVSAFHDYNIEIKFTRSGGNEDGEITIVGFTWEGYWDINKIDTAVVNLTESQSPLIIDMDDVFKVFNLDGYELIARNVTNLEIEYRISQNDKRSWTEWTPLTNENIKTEKIDPIRFFNIQYKLTHLGGTDTIMIRDLNLVGEFINVSKNYTTINLLGIREECKNGSVGNTGLNGGNGDGSFTSNLESEPSVWTTLDCNEGDLFNPYNLGEAIDLYNKLSNDASNIGGWTVEYFKTSPDSKGIDHSIHEYNLKNVIKRGDVKIMVPDNQFPNNQIAFNQFDLALLESFEVHLTKEAFKKVFGPQHRPSKDDYLYLCDISKMFSVVNSQAIRDFGNASVYYKLILGKYNQKANVKTEEGSSIQERVHEITQNSTLEDLFGTEMKADKEKIALKPQRATLTNDNIRTNIKASVDVELIDNAELVLSKYHYNLSGINPEADAVVYKAADNYLREGDNRSFVAWIKLLDYADSDSYNLINNYSNDLEKGYRIDITNNELITTINSASYSTSLEDKLIDDVWYCVLVNIDQRQRKIKQHLFKRNVDREVDAQRLLSTKLRLLISEEMDYIPNSFEVDEGDITMKITGSNMKITNIRIYNSVVADDQITKTLNQQIVRDTDQTILADNANKIYVLPRYSLDG